MNSSTAMSDINTIFSKFNISKVVYVDDDISEITADDIIASQKRSVIMSKFFPNLLVGDEAIENNKLKNNWEDIPFEIKQIINQTIQVDAQGTDKTHKEVLSLFTELIPSERVVSMSPDLWEREKDKYLADSKTILFLFDQDLKNDGRNEGGIEIIKKISKSNNVISGLLTHMASKETCLQYRDEMSIKHNIGKDCFFVIPKKDVVNNQSLFVYLLKLTVLNTHFIPFKAKVNEITKKVNEITRERIEKIGIEDLDQIIFQVPQKEGSWEPDMFFRLYSGFQRQEFNKKACSDEDLQKSISKIREVSNISTDTVSFLMPSEAWNIQHDELYDNAEHLNKNHLPIDVGDIFEKIEKQGGIARKYILLTQQCDLMIRTTGRRSRSEKRFALVEIMSLPDPKPDTKKLTAFERELPYYDTVNNKHWKIKYKDVYLVKDYILDLCAYNADGVAKYSSNYEPDNSIRPSLINRYGKIQKQIDDKRKTSEEVFRQTENIGGEIQKTLYEAIFHDDLFKVEYEQNESGFILTFNCKRIGRLLSERAVGLSAEFYATMQRPPYPRGYDQVE